MQNKPAQGGGLAYIAEALRPLAVPIETLNPDAANARTHDERNIAAIKASLERFGQRLPIVVQRQGMVVRAGNGRLTAAKLLGWTHLAAVVVDESDVEAVSFAIADNRTAELAAWDDGALASLLQSLPAEARIGFDDSDLTRLLDGLRGPVEEDEAPEPLAEAVSRRGDVWTLGNHRLMCGDSRDPADATLLMGGERASCVFTDPPYGVSIGAKNRMLNSVQKGGRCLTDIVDDELSPDALKAELVKAFESLRKNIMSDDCTLFVTAPQGGELGMMMMMMMSDAGLPVRHVLIWKKNQPTFSMGRLDYEYKHEPILLTWGARHKRPMSGEHRSSVWEIDRPRASPDHPTIDRPRASPDHPTTKPVSLYVNAYLNNSDTGDIVADIYAGSGTAIAAAEQSGRRCFAIEIEPKYVDVAIRRWQNLTGKAATLDGKTWSDVAAERGVKVD